MLLQHLKHKAIDKKRWDEKINASTGHLPYGQSWFLDIVSPGWEAIISENYDYIMPLPVKRKFRIGYLVQPLYTQQLGIFSSQSISSEIITLFLSKINYRSYQFNLNENNFYENAVAYPNLVLKLNNNYETIFKNFTKNTQRNIEKALKKNNHVEELTSTDECLLFLSKSEDFLPFKPSELINIIIKKGLELNKIRILGVRNLSGELIATSCFLVTKLRLVYLYPVSNEEGKKDSAMFALIDYVIRKFENTNTLLDFEGSRIDGVARFYKGFGAINQPYYMVKKYRPDFLTGKF